MPLNEQDTSIQVKKDEISSDSAASFLLIVSGCLFLGGLYVIGLQCVSYLRDGYWTSYSIIELLKWLEIDWASYPQDWLGLHQLMGRIPLSLGFIGSSLVAFIKGITLDPPERR